MPQKTSEKTLQNLTFCQGILGRLSVKKTEKKPWDSARTEFGPTAVEKPFLAGQVRPSEPFEAGPVRFIPGPSEALQRANVSAVESNAEKRAFSAVKQWNNSEGGC